MVHDGIFQVKVILALLCTFLVRLLLKRSIVRKPQEIQTFLFWLPENLLLHKKRKRFETICYTTVLRFTTSY